MLDVLDKDAIYVLFTTTLFNCKAELSWKPVLIKIRCDPQSYENCLCPINCGRCFAALLSSVSRCMFMRASPLLVRVRRGQGTEP